MRLRPFVAAAALTVLAFTGAACSGSAPAPHVSAAPDTPDPAAAQEAARNGLHSLLVAAMTGSFSSQAQSLADSSYFDIRLQMVPIWTQRDDGAWLYVEQAAAAALDRPYRQRVYRVTAEEDGSFRSEVFSIPEPLRFAGAWREEAPLADITPDSLEVREGCAVILHPTETGFRGSTVDAECQSSLRGASYATSEVVVRPDRIESWDRGFDAEGEQVWGAVEGPYIFLRTSQP